LAIGVAYSQGDQHTAQRQSGITLNSAEIAGREELVKKVPYIGTAVVESTQPLADGNRIFLRTEEKVYRDSQGRTRHEEVLNRIGPLSGDPPRFVFISDPIKKEEFTLNPREKTYSVQPRIDIDAFLRSMRSRSEAGRRPNGTPPTSTPPNGTPPTGTPPNGTPPNRSTSQIVKTDLGSKIIDGYLVSGERLTVTVPAGSVGNDKALETSLETWYSPELHVYLYRRRVDPRFGEILYRLTDIRRTEPEARLFRIPRDYRLRK
jgi:hypothetical protein